MKPTVPIHSAGSAHRLRYVAAFLLVLVCSLATAQQYAWLTGEGGEHFNRVGIYGTQGSAAASNRPGSRSGAAKWKTSADHLWLFGGSGYGAGESTGTLNDLWKYDVVSGHWTWIKGSISPNQQGTYGTQGIAAVGNSPGARNNAASWTDNSGNLWLFGGEGFAASSPGLLHDLWKYDVVTGHWTWIKGSNTPNQAGIYGAQGVPAANSVPGARTAAVTWSDNSGKLWLFGGRGYGAAGTGKLNDLWSFDIATGNWTWVKGGSAPAQPGLYGTRGVAAAANLPGSRDATVSWKDASGNLWMFGGSGNAAGAAQGRLNDVWKYDTSSGNWTWMKGSNAIEQAATYGTLGVAAAANTPGARQDSISWTDGTGNFWLLGGEGHAVSSSGCLNDLWKYDIASGNWMWKKGNNEPEWYGVYGTQGVASPGNTPGARYDSVSWTDNSGRLWLFGGFGYGTEAATSTTRNDLWSYSVATDNWTWINGAISDEAAFGTYGVQGVASPANTPDARLGAHCWTDQSGNFWMFGGKGHGVASKDYQNDFWKYNASSGQWTWMKGSNLPDQTGTYGTPGVAAPANTPGARYYAVTWTDNAGNFWMLGGFGWSATDKGYLSDLWKYNIAANTWTWIKGSNQTYQLSTFGTRGVAAPANLPGSRTYATGWTDNAGNFWLFGGYDFAEGHKGYLNDLWKYDVASGNWAWMKGSTGPNDEGVYGTQGVAAPANTPGARYGSITWTDHSGNLWLFGGKHNDEYVNDLWKYDITTGNWAWMKGDEEYEANGTYGTLGVAAPGNTPGARYGSVAWTDHFGKLWLFGGFGYAIEDEGLLNDLWRYDISSGNWTWIKGSAQFNLPGTYGVRGVPAAGNTPGCRVAGIGARSSTNILYLFGGYGYGAEEIALNELWALHLPTAAPDWTLYD